MYRKLLSWMLMLCMCLSILPGINSYAMEDQENVGGTVFAVDSIEAGEQGVSGEGEIEIPQNGLKGHMEGAEALPAASGRQLVQKTPNKQYTVLVLDNSPSVDFYQGSSVLYTADTALPYVKEASKKLVEDMRDAPGDNYIAIVSFDINNSGIVSRFTNDTDTLLKAIDRLSAMGDHNVCGGLAAAEKLIDSVSDRGAAKNVILFTTGMTNSGTYSKEGKYNSSTIGGDWTNKGSETHLYEFANAAYEEAERLKEKCTLYSIGLFQTMKDMPQRGRDIVSFFKLCACDWASSEECFYDVKDPSDLEFVFGQVADDVMGHKGTFSYLGTGKDYTATYYYDDNYFSESSYKYNQHLATMSLCLDLSTWGSAEEADYTRKMKHAENLLSDIGFVGFDHNYTDFSGKGISGKPTMDSVGVVAANKQLSFDGRDYTLIAVAIRGGGYEREWASNFTIGESGDHQGFSQARDIVISFLEDYVVKQGIRGDLKIWITGYSRAAATANMVAAALDDGTVELGGYLIATTSDNEASHRLGCSLKPEDVYAYTFETPAGTVNPDARNKRYGNIFNIINRNDPVPKVAPNGWKFRRYGVDRCIPSPEVNGIDDYEEKAAAMLERYQGMDGYEGYAIDDFRMKTLRFDFDNIALGGEPFIFLGDNPKDPRKQSQFLDDYVTIMAKEVFKDRSTYVVRYQNEIRYACGLFFGEDSTKINKLFDLAAEKFGKDWGEIVLGFVQGGADGAYQVVAEFLRECLDNAEISSYSQQEFDAAVAAILNLVVSVTTQHPFLTSTLALNIAGIGQAHYPELCLAWMQSMDANYTTEGIMDFLPGMYRVVRINCPIDVTVYDTEGNVLAAIIDDTPQPDGHVVAAYTAEGEKLLYLPVNHEYIVRLAATGDGVMNLAIQEYDPYAGESNHLILFHDIEVREGQEYTMCLPCYSQEDMESMTGTAADTDYTLFFDSTEILPSEELTGEEVFNAYYEVDASADDAAKGLVFGAGIRQYGSFVKLEALAYDGYEFVGWYEGENLVSTETEYRFRVSEDRELVAVFQDCEGGKEGKGDKEDKGDKGDKGDKEDKGDENDREDGRKGAVEGAFRVLSHWSTGFNAEITLTNMTEETIHDWEVVFDLPYDIESVWNGVMVSHENGVYTVRNAGYNWDIQPAECVTFGFCVTAETETVTEPTAYVLVERQAEAVEGDFEVTYKVHSDWGTGFNGQIEIRNLSAKAVQDWTLEFDCAHTFTQFGNGEIVSHEGDHYIIKNKGYNAAIETGQTLVLDFTADCGDADSGVEPTGYMLHAARGD